MEFVWSSDDSENAERDAFYRASVLLEKIKEKCARGLDHILSPQMCAMLFDGLSVSRLKWPAGVIKPKFWEYVAATSFDRDMDVDGLSEKHCWTYYGVVLESNCIKLISARHLIQLYAPLHPDEMHKIAMQWELHKDSPHRFDHWGVRSETCSRCHEYIWRDSLENAALSMPPQLSPPLLNAVTSISKLFEKPLPSRGKTIKEVGTKKTRKIKLD